VSAAPLRTLRFAALLQVVLAIAYIATGTLWTLAAPRGSNAFKPADPYLAILELLILVSAAGYVVLTAAALALAPDDRRHHGASAIAFAAAFAALTCGAHFAQLTVLPRSPAPISAWPSVPATLDLLAWDLFFGLSLLFLALALPPELRRTRRTFGLGGALCVAGLSGPLSGDLRFHLIATAGYAFVFPVACAVLWFATRRPGTGLGRRVASDGS